MDGHPGPPAGREVVDLSFAPELEGTDDGLGSDARRAAAVRFGVLLGHEMPPSWSCGAPAGRRSYQAPSRARATAARRLSWQKRPTIWMPTGRRSTGAGTANTGWPVVLNGRVRRVSGSR